MDQALNQKIDAFIAANKEQILEDIAALVDRALLDARGLDGAVQLTSDARDALVRLSAGDARRALTALEAAAAGVGQGEVDAAAVEVAVQAYVPVYDRDGDGLVDKAGDNPPQTYYELFKW